MDIYEIIKKLSADLAKAEFDLESSKAKIEKLKEDNDRYFAWWQEEKKKREMLEVQARHWKDQCEEEVEAHEAN